MAGMDENPYQSPQSRDDERLHPIRRFFALHHCADGGRCRKTYFQLGARIAFAVLATALIWRRTDPPPPVGLLTVCIELNLAAYILLYIGRELQCRRGRYLARASLPSTHPPPRHDSHDAEGQQGEG